MFVVMLLPLTGWAGRTSKIDEEENLFIVNTYISWLAKNLSFLQATTSPWPPGWRGDSQNGIWRQREGPVTVPHFVTSRVDLRAGRTAETVSGLSVRVARRFWGRSSLTRKIPPYSLRNPLSRLTSIQNNCQVCCWVWTLYELLWRHSDVRNLVFVKMLLPLTSQVLSGGRIYL